MVGVIQESPELMMYFVRWIYMHNKHQQRKNLRLKNYDYSQPGYYFVTICTHNKVNLFGKIVGAIQESPKLPQMKLNKYGIIVQSIIENLPKRFSNIKIDNYVIMPNHIHMIIVILETRAIPESPLQKRSLLSQIVGYLKMNTSKHIHAINKNINVWQRGYHDHIIRGQQDYLKIYEYIETNPLKWELDKYYNFT